MYLEHLHINNVRAISQADLSLSPRMNLFTGPNGSGKTSLLESIAILGMGRSFRSTQIKSVITDKEDKLTIFGKLSNDSTNLGISRDRTGKFKIRINNIDQNKLSILASYLPVLVITPDTYKLLTSGPQHRRQFLDCSVFHVEHVFSTTWQRHNKILKQRNALLKNCKSYNDLAIWDKEFVELAETINKARNDEFLLLKSHLEVIQSIFLPQYRVQYQYYSGWDSRASQTLAQQLVSNFETDKRYGYTAVGAHKADLKISIDNRPVHEVLSRGEQKMLVNAMHIAQAKRLSMDLSKNCLMLIDDLPSELDNEKQQLLINELTKLPDVQVFITAISNTELSNESFNNKKLMTKVFHVEHGQVKIAKN